MYICSFVIELHQNPILRKNFRFSLVFMFVFPGAFEHFLKVFFTTLTRSYNLWHLKNEINITLHTYLLAIDYWGVVDFNGGTEIFNQGWRIFNNFRIVISNKIVW